ncbi:speckle-type POZ protein B-like [Planococcus citri]|uniref:speckle-type POZ protein B-like n=1 Tax=Planococcus citri TaxID=170843 RepID=UPI0031F93499
MYTKRNNTIIIPSNDDRSELSCSMNDDFGANTFVVENWCHTRSEVNYCNFMWTIHQYSEYHFHRPSESYINSSIFKSTKNDTYKWKLQLSAPDEDKMITLYLMLDATPELCKEVLVKCKMSVVNNEGEETNIRRDPNCVNDKGEETPIRQDPSNYANLAKGSSAYYLAFIDFINGNDLLKEENSLLRGGALNIFCEIHFFSKETITTECSSGKIVVELHQAPDGNDLQRGLERLFENEDFADFTVSIGDEQFRVHKAILAARSEVFASMFKHNLKEQNENCLKIIDMDQTVFREMLRYIYTGNLSKLEEMAVDLLPAAEKYNLQELKTMCEHQLVNRLSAKNAVDCLLLADMYGAGFLKKKALRFIRVNLEAIKKTENWLKIMHSDLLRDVFNTIFP